MGRGADPSRGGSGSRDGGGSSWTAALPLALLMGCATGHDQVPLTDPASFAAGVSRQGGPDSPHQLEFSWRYADDRGSTHGDGVVRYNPPDSLRLDFFGPGDASMAVAITPSGLRSLGQIEDLRLPPRSFLYATAGIFRPGRERPSGGFRSDGAVVLVYPVGNGGARRYVVRDGRVRGVEERHPRGGDRTLHVRWRDEGEWPTGARYRDDREGSRAEWRLESARRATGRYPRRIYDLPESPEGG